MSRLASTAKAGFYPTPDRVTELIASCVISSGSGGKLLDPCAGEGVAAAYVAKAWNLEGYGIEIDAERALTASSRLHRVLHLDCSSARAPHQAFQALWLNPPYDNADPSSNAQGEGRRTEYTFLRDTTKWLQPGGLIIYIVPQYRVDARMAGFLATSYESIHGYRLPDEEYATFRQVVIFAIAKPKPNHDEKSAMALLQQCRSALPVLPEQIDDEERYHLPTPTETTFYFRGSEINPQEALAEAIESGAWKTFEWQDWLSPRKDLAAFRPPMPLKKGHLAMLIAAGLMQNLQLESMDGKEKLFVKGRTYKIQEEMDSEDETEDITRDRFVTEIVALDLNTGSHVKIAEPTALAEFVEKWRDVLTKRVMETFVPLYQFDLDAEGAQVATTLNRLSKHRHVPGRKETGLFPAQKHVAVALWKRLQRSKSAILVGEMGTGKTTVASAVSELIRECDSDQRPTLVLTPPHLVPKWVREIQQIVPMAFAMPLNRLSDVTLFVRQVSRLAPGTPAFAVLSREMAKLGSGWQLAYVVRKKYERVELANGEIETIIEKTFACPRCGKEVWYVEDGHETAPVRDAAYFAERKRKCVGCDEPFYQMVHLNSARVDDSSEMRLLDAEKNTTPATLRYPIADYIARRYPGFFKLLIGDEIHELKGQSTDQGYALGALVRACDRTLALTGTIFGGKSTSLFFLLHRLSPRVRSQFKWSDGQKWSERYGLLERVTKRTEGENGYGTYSGKRRRQTYVRELPGASPQLATLLLDNTAFLNVTDLGFQLPSYREYVHEIVMANDQREAYDALENQLVSELKKRLVTGDRSLLAAYLQSLLAYPNSCFRAEVIQDSKVEVVASAPALSGVEGGEERLFPKEEWLIELAQAERDRGRRVLVFCRQTGTRDITGQRSGWNKNTACIP